MYIFTARTKEGHRRLSPDEIADIKAVSARFDAILKRPQYQERLDAMMLRWQENYRPTSFLKSVGFEDLKFLAALACEAMEVPSDTMQFDFDYCEGRAGIKFFGLADFSVDAQEKPRTHLNYGQYFPEYKAEPGAAINLAALTQAFANIVHECWHYRDFLQGKWSNQPLSLHRADIIADRVYVKLYRPLSFLFGLGFACLSKNPARNFSEKIAMGERIWHNARELAYRNQHDERLANMAALELVHRFSSPWRNMMRDKGYALSQNQRMRNMSGRRAQPNPKTIRRHLTQLLATSREM